jgi:hypothetical protein
MADFSRNRRQVSTGIGVWVQTVYAYDKHPGIIDEYGLDLAYCFVRIMAQQNKYKRISHHQDPVRIRGLLYHSLMFIFIGCTALFPREISAQITPGSPTTYTNDGKVLTFKHTVEDGGGRLLVVGIGFEDGDERVVSVRYGGNNLSLIAGRSAKNNDDDPHVSAWYLVDPPVGNNTVQVVFSDDGEAGVGAISFRGVDQDNPIGNITVASAETGAPNITIRSFNGAIVMDVIAHAKNVKDGPRPGNAQTQQWRLGLDGDGPTTGASTREGEEGNVTMTWHDASGEWAAIGFNINPAVTIIAAPATPTLASPGNNATNVSLTPTLSWNAAVRAQTYQVQVSTASNFGTTVINQSGITATSYAVTSALQYNTKYYWRVRASNDGRNSDWSTARTFTTIIAAPATPTLASPGNNATNVSLTPTLSWNAAARAERYRVQLSTNSNFTSVLVVDKDDVTGTKYAVTGLANSTQYYWRVKALNAGGESDWSTVRTFTTIIAAPAGPTLVSPENNATGISITPTISWNATDRATTYRVQISTVSNFNTTVVDEDDISNTSYTVVTALQNSTQYYWRVRAISIVGESNWSTARTFATIIAAPDAPVLDAPADEAIDVSIDPTFEWNAVATADRYHIQVAPDEAFSIPTINEIDITTTTYDGSGLSNNTKYYWRVRGINDGGDGEWSEVREFTTIIARPAMPTLVSPANNATGQPTTLTVEWNAAARAETYHVQVAEMQNFSAEIVVDQNEIVATQYTVSGLEYGKRYYWHVNATNTSGTGPWSDVWNFTVIPTGTHTISLRTGWNLVSSYMEPLDSTTTSVFESIGDNLIIVKDGTGKTYFPALGVDDIGNWNYSRGYEIYLSPDTDELEIFGIQRKPDSTPIELLAGWNMIGYIRTDQVDVATALNSIENNLIIAKNGSGQVYLPAGVIGEDPINTMGTMKPGEGYQMYLTSQSELLYPPYSVIPQQDIAGGANVLQSVEQVIVKPQRYIVDGNTGSNAVLIVTSEEFLAGDEIGVRTSAGMLTGSGVVQTTGRAAVTVWGNNLQQPDSISGALEGETLALFHWSAKDKQERNLIIHNVTDIIAGTSSAGEIVFTNDAVVAATVEIEYEIPEAFELYQNYPNPFNPTTTFRYALPKDGRVVLEVYNLLGQRVRTLVDEEHRAGTYEIVFDGSDLSSGTYFYRIHTPDHTAIKKFILLK